MNYKKILKSRNLRIKILKMFSFVPDSAMVRFQYFIKLGRKLNLKNPQRYSEKIQWYKLNYKEELMAVCSDKADVRNYVKECGLEEILNECYGVFNSIDDIDFEKLPGAFVVKDTLGGGGNSVVLVENKDNEDLGKLRNTMLSWLEKPTNKKSSGREWVYENRKHRVMIERLLKNDESGDLHDYKFFCFNGKVYCSYKMENYTKNHAAGVMGFFDRDFNLLPVRRADFAPMENQPQKPENYEKMVEYAEILSAPFPHARVDFYNVDRKVVFGELTFFNASGYVQFVPDEFDFEMGKNFLLPEKRRKRGK